MQDACRESDCFRGSSRLADPTPRAVGRRALARVRAAGLVLLPLSGTTRRGGSGTSACSSGGGTRGRRRPSSPLWRRWRAGCGGSLALSATRQLSVQPDGQLWLPPRLELLPEGLA